LQIIDVIYISIFHSGIGLVFFELFILLNKILIMKAIADIFQRDLGFFKLLQFSNEKHTNNPSSAGFLPWCNNWGLIFGARESEWEYSERSDSCPNKWDSCAYCNPPFPREKKKKILRGKILLKERILN